MQWRHDNRICRRDVGRDPERVSRIEVSFKRRGLDEVVTTRDDEWRCTILAASAAAVGLKVRCQGLYVSQPLMCLSSQKKAAG